MLFTSRDRCSGSIAKLCCAFFLWAACRKISSDMLQNGIAHICPCETKRQEGASHRFGTLAWSEGIAQLGLLQRWYRNIARYGATKISMSARGTLNHYTSHPDISRWWGYSAQKVDFSRESSLRNLIFNVPLQDVPTYNLLSARCLAMEDKYIPKSSLTEIKGRQWNFAGSWKPSSTTLENCTTPSNVSKGSGLVNL